ncbi:MAG: hypothetical protein Cons2KO_34990 [Congregibacter sp.]
MRNALDSIFIACVALCLGTAAVALGIESDNKGDALAQAVAQLQARADLRLIESSPEQAVAQFRVPLGAMQKVRGVWAPEYAVRVSGQHRSWTWRLEEGFSAGEVLAEIESVLTMTGATLANENAYKSEGQSIEAEVARVFTCDARACGSSSQWANRIFGQRLLYGTEASQRYRVYAVRPAGSPIGAEGSKNEKSDDFTASWLILYASARTANRQHIHAELLQGVQSQGD